MTTPTTETIQAAPCICSIICSEDPDENECEVCKLLDPYAPCPNTGYGCRLLEDDPCDCCTDEQRAKCKDVTP